MTDDGNHPLHISHIKDIGWSIEMRYDLQSHSIARQPFTGAQERLALSALSTEAKKGDIIIRCGDDSLHLHARTGKMSIHDADRLSFVSAEHPFSHHPEPIELYEGLMSLKVTDFEERAPFGPKGTLFNTRMARFQYDRPSDTILGLAGQSGEMNRNGYRFELYNTDEFLHTPARKPLYQSWPILFHRSADQSHWVCVFHDNPTRTFVDIGDFYPDLVTFESQGCNTRVYVITGETLAEVSCKLTMLLGGNPLPPLWAFGYQQCRWSYMSTEDIHNIVQSFTRHDIPLDAIYYDIDYMDGFRVFTTNALTFGEMADCIAETKRDGIHSVCIVDPGVKVDEEYAVYRRIMESRAHLLNEDGSPFQGKVWAGTSVFPDFGDEKTRELWSDMQKEWLERYSFDGVWNDMNEFSNFDGGNAKSIKAATARGPIANEWNLYGYYMAKASRMGMEKWKPNERSVVITRSGYPGVQQHAVIWHGDNQAWWEHLRLALDMAIQYSLSGAYYTGPDVPGFTGNPPDDLAVRFFQLGAFLPLFRGHSIYFSKDKEPYAYGAEANGIIRDTIRLRYSLLREWYSGFEHAIRTNTPPLLPVLDETSTIVRDHVLLFDKFLFAPVMQRDERVKLLYLPEGTWYRFGDTTKPLDGGRWIQMAVEFSTLPLFVRAGSIVVRNSVAKTAKETLAGKETFDVYPDASGAAEGYWYNDDGVSVADTSTMRMRLTWNGKSIERIKVDL